MIEILRTKVVDRFENPVSSPRDCELLSEEVFKRTGRSISPTTLRRFFGMLKSKSAISAYNLDTLSIFCGSADYTHFCEEFGLLREMVDHEFEEIAREIGRVTKFTLNSIGRKSLTNFNETIPREKVNGNIDAFLSSDHTVMPIVAPGGYGKSIALAHKVKAWQARRTRRPLCFFCTAPVLYQLIISSRHSSEALNLNLSDSRNLFKRFSRDNSESYSHLVLVIDALDELDGNHAKMNHVMEFITDVTNQFHRAGFLKIILAVREVIWNGSILPGFAGRSPGWMIPEKADSVDSVASNLPLLSHSEVREIILRSNKKRKKNLVYDSIEWELREMIRIPLHLYFLSRLVSLAVPLEHISADQLMYEYIDDLVYKTRFSEEKSDIIGKIIELSLHYRNAFSVIKRELKEVFPIHLKSESHYYTAYNDLLSFGILVEEKMKNRFGVRVTFVHFSHLNFYYYLIALFLLNRSEIVDFELFRQIALREENLEWRSSVIANLFRLAYKHEIIDALRDFCKLPEEILSTITVRHAVGSCFRQDNRIRTDLVRAYASCPVGQKQFFEWYVDTNYLFNNYVVRIREYLEHKKTREAQLFGHGILFLAGFYSLNAKECGEQIGLINRIEPDRSIHPWPIGRRVSSNILYRHIVQNDPIDDLESYISGYTSIAYGYDQYLDKGVIEYEMMIMVAVVLLGEYKLLMRLIVNAYEQYKLDDPKHAGFSWMHMHQNSFAGVFLAYARFKIDGRCSRKVPEHWESILDQYASVFDDFHCLILIHYFLFDYYMTTGDMDKALLHHREGLELSRFAGYDFYEAFLLKKGAVLDAGYGPAADQMIRSSGFNPSANCFQAEIPQPELK